MIDSQAESGVTAKGVLAAPVVHPFHDNPSIPGAIGRLSGFLRYAHDADGRELQHRPGSVRVEQREQRDRPPCCCLS